MENTLIRNKSLAEELADKLDDTNDIGFYYTLAKQHDHEFLRGIMYWVVDYPNAGHKGKLFSWKLKNELSKKSVENIAPPTSDSRIALLKAQAHELVGKKL